LWIRRSWPSTERAIHVRILDKDYGTPASRRRGEGFCVDSYELTEPREPVTLLCYAVSAQTRRCGNEAEATSFEPTNMKMLALPLRSLLLPAMGRP
jgi:hypothetical protein